MPGHVTGVFTHRESGTAGIVLMNSSTPGDPAAFAARLVDTVLDREPEEPEPWRPGTDLPGELVPLLGRWYSEGRPWDLVVRDGALRARAPEWPSERPAWGFEQVEPDLFRTTSGMERGELLRVLRRPDGSVESLRWATYRMTREPLGFGEEPDPTR